MYLAIRKLLGHDAWGPFGGRGIGWHQLPCTTLSTAGHVQSDVGRNRCEFVGGSEEGGGRGVGDSAVSGRGRFERCEV